MKLLPAPLIPPYVLSTVIAILLLASATFAVGQIGATIYEFAGGLDDQVSAEADPVDISRVPAAQHGNRAAVDGQRIIAETDVAAEPPVRGVEFQQMRQRPGVRDVVDGDDLHVVPPGGDARECAPDPAETVDSDFRSHVNPFPSIRSAFTCPSTIIGQRSHPW